MMSKEKREWVDHDKELNWIDRLVSEEDKVKIESLLRDEEFLTLMKIKHSLFIRWDRENQAVNPSKGMVIQQEITMSC